MKRKITGLLTACLMIFSSVGFTGCGDNSKNKISEAQNSAWQDKISDELSSKATAFKTVDIESDEKNTEYYALTYKNGLFYAACYDNSNSDMYILALDDSGRTVNKISVYAQTDPDTSCNFLGNAVITDSNGNIGCLLHTQTKDIYSGEQIDAYRLMKFGSDGNTVTDKELPDFFADEDRQANRSIGECVCDENGNIFVNMGNCVKAFDKDGNFLFVTDTAGSFNSYIQGLILTNDGIPAVGLVHMGENPSFSLVEVDINTKSFGTEHKLPITYAERICSGSGDHICYIPGDTGVGGFRADTLEYEQVLDLLDIGVDTDPELFISCEDGSFLIGGYSKISGVTKKLYSLIIPIDESEIKQRESITIGYFSTLSSFWTATVARFNRTNDEYFINAVNYYDKNDETIDYDTALVNFNNSLLSGNMPDLLIFDDSMPYDSYVNKGLFADLYEFMDKDSEMNRDAFLPNILSVLENDDGLYSMALDFFVLTEAGRYSIIGDNDSLTFDKAWEMVDSLTAGATLSSDILDRQSFISRALEYNSFVDYQNAVCSFDSDEFKNILEMFPGDKTLSYDVTAGLQGNCEMMMNNNALLINELFRNFEGFYHLENDVLGEKAAFTGFPNNDGVNGLLHIDSRIAIAANSENKEAAWEFIKSALKNTVVQSETELYDPTSNETFTEKRWVANTPFGGTFPVLTEYLEKLGMQATVYEKSYNVEGELVDAEPSVSFGDGIKMTKRPDQEDILRYIDYIESIDTLDRTDEYIDEIISEEISAFTAGANTADKTAKNIQSRVSIYLSEQYG